MSNTPKAGSRAGAVRGPTQQDYQALAEFRHVLQRFQTFSQGAARATGLAPRQHQALLAIKGFVRPGGVTIQELAERLCIQHHSTVELVDRLVEAGLVVRRGDLADRRRIFLDLTPAAETVLLRLSAIHLQELQRLRPTLVELLEGLGDADGAETA